MSGIRTNNICCSAIFVQGLELRVQVCMQHPLLLVCMLFVMYVCMNVARGMERARGRERNGERGRHILVDGQRDVHAHGPVRYAMRVCIRGTGMRACTRPPKMRGSAVFRTNAIEMRARPMPSSLRDQDARARARRRGQTGAATYVGEKRGERERYEQSLQRPPS